jgi:hypothetical protein
MRFFHVISTSLMIPGLIGLSACNRADEGMRGRTRDTGPDATGKAHVRYVNALSRNTGAELYSGDTKLFGGEKQTETDYVQVPADRRTFQLRHSGNADAEPLATNSEGLRRDAHYTVIAYDDDDGKATLRVLTDEESAADSGKAKVRVIDASARADDFALHFSGRGGDKVVGEPLLGAVSSWKEVDPGQGGLELRTDDNKAKAVPVSDVRLQAGKLYTFVVRDGRTAAQSLEVIALENEPTRLPMTAPPMVPSGE